jgi:FkbM family methyltransferase
MTRPGRGRLRGVPVRALDAVVAWQMRSAGLVSLRGHHVLASPLVASSVVLDAGAHRGEFGTQVFGRFGCRVVSLEPVPELFAAIPTGVGRSKIQAALAPADGVCTLHLSSNPEGHSLRPALAALEGSPGTIAVAARALPTLLSELGLSEIDLLKLDIEGAEIGVFDSLPDEVLRAIGQISVEFHDFLPGNADGPAILRIKGRLERLGFLTVQCTYALGHHADTLFINRERHPPSLVARMQHLALAAVTLPARRLVQTVLVRAHAARSS